ncbi:hypothetical protein K8O68_02285 [Salipaludibacillus sp. CUR1]|uniref:TIGR04104 family putative zinc finger protein n=1 Tax=Salipaludibacillus sp. CUR1 TaxID=2820003 RepID=UPI001E53EE14|nr:TIGR04104 family putative zinc finger protein [Salipaludibacillus sp. CUR1]MCE7791247.1 hypothetical protein [Salipaludibacillus sp. CUR1]
MRLPDCLFCGRSFRYKELLLFMRSAKKCPRCENSQYISPDSRLKGALYSFFFVVLFTLGAFFINASPSLYFISGLVILIGAIAASPLLIRFTRKEEPLF